MPQMSQMSIVRCDLVRIQILTNLNNTSIVPYA